MSLYFIVTCSFIEFHNQHILPSFHCQKSSRATNKKLARLSSWIKPHKYNATNFFNTIKLQHTKTHSQPLKKGCPFFCLFHLLVVWSFSLGLHSSKNSLNFFWSHTMNSLIYIFHKQLMMILLLCIRPSFICFLQPFFELISLLQQSFLLKKLLQNIFYQRVISNHISYDNNLHHEYHLLIMSLL